MEGAFSLETVAIKRPRADLFFLRNSVFFKFVYIFFSKSALKRSVWRAFWSQGPPKSAPSSFQLIKGLFGRCVFPADRCKKEASGRLLFFELFVFSHFLHNSQTMFWRLCFWSQGPTQECSKDPQGQSQAGPQGPKLRVCACKSAHQWIGRTHIRAHRPETALPKTTQEPKGPPKAPESTQEPPQHAQTCTEGVVPATSATTLRHTSPGLLRRSRAQHFDGGGGVRAQRVLDPPPPGLVPQGSFVNFQSRSVCTSGTYTTLRSVTELVQLLGRPR